MNKSRLALLFRDKGVTDIHLRTNVPPMVRSQGRWRIIGNLKPLGVEQIRAFAFDLMNDSQRRAFEGRPEVDFSTDGGDLPKLRIKFFLQAGQPALTVRDVSRSRKHPSLAAPPAKRHWVRLTRVCNDKCNFCLDSEAQDGTSLPVHAIEVDLRKGRQQGLSRVVLSGGEPTIHPDYVEIVRKAREQGYSHIQTVTNGRRMCYPDFLKQCVEAGLSEVTFSLHGNTPEMHDSQTGSPGSFLQGLLALRHALTIPNLIVSVDVVISRQNVRHLREILDFFIREGVHEFDLLQVIPFGAAWENQDALFYDVEAERPHLHRALDLSKRGDIVIWTNRLDPRHLEGYEDLIQPPAKLHDEYKGRGVMFDNFLRLGIKPNCWGRCSHCFLEKSCRDIAALHEDGALAAHPVAECLKSHPETLAGSDESAPTTLAHTPALSMKEFVSFYIDRRYVVKGSACGRCKFDAACAGAPVDHVRRYGFPKPGAGMER
ncbi:MAG: radical SAM protein [Elusimicrobia bacterium]|nr:radical SAM protein [Elusimicrobiota bacterium]